jgi:hypothetical protein
MRLQAGKTTYSEGEAAQALGLSLGRFRRLLLQQLSRRHAFHNLQLLRFRPCDLLLLRIFEQPGQAKGA